MLDLTAITAANRFGLGARPEEVAVISRNPRGWLKGQIEKPNLLPASLQGFPSGTDQARIFLEARLSKGDAGVMELVRERWRDDFMKEAAASIEAAVTTDTPFIERLVRFWSNHFTVSVQQRPPVLGLAGAFEREAIRPHVCGKFVDMLIAVTRHPAMLFYLDNAQSIGPASTAGRNLRRGLNENFARELLELHTVGVDGGYTQDDVRVLAEILTGWGVARPSQGGNPGEPNAGTFRFRPMAHQPGDKVILKTLIKESGENEGLAALQFLARHPATARHIATKLARHFISDTPSRDAVMHLERVFRESGGDLGHMARALVDMPETWASVQSKIRSPQELMIAGLRAAAVRKVEGNGVLAPLRDMGQVPWSAGSPAGWGDTASAWVSPDAALHRVEWAAAAGQRLSQGIRPGGVVEFALGETAHPETVEAVERAPSAGDGLGLVFASAEFQRR